MHAYVNEKRKRLAIEEKCATLRTKHDGLKEKYADLKRRYEELKKSRDGELSAEALAFQSRLRELELLEPESLIWYVHEMLPPEQEGGPVSWKGFVMLPRKRSAPLPRFTLNGQALEAVYFPMSTGELTRTYWFSPDYEAAEFQLWATVPDELREAEISYHLPGGPPGYSWFIPLYDNDPVPDEGKRNRVIIGGSAEYFLIGGYTAYRRYDQVLQRLFGKRTVDFPRILDWGCGYR
jgi:hypothetical protein